MLSKLKKYRVWLLVPMLTMFLAACSTSPVTEKSDGIWDKFIIYNFSKVILWLADLFGGQPGWGIVAFTILVRVFIFPLSWMSMKTMRQQQELAPELKKIQAKYPGKDTASRQKVQEETQALYAASGVNPLAGCFPLLVQFPVLIALYQTISRTDALKNGSFLWMKLSQPDPYYILPILAAIFTFLTSYLSMMSQPEKNGMTTSMTYIMPLVILFTAFNMPAAISIYWVATNAFSVLQTLLIQNPFKIKRERREAEQKERNRRRAINRAKKKVTKKH